MKLQSRPAKPAPVAVNLLKSAAQTSGLWLVCFLALPAAIRLLEDVAGLSAMRFGSEGLRPAAIFVFAAAALVGFWGGFSLVSRGDGTPMPLACTRNFVVAGPYRYIRNPMAAMGITQGIAVGVYLGSPLTILYALIGAVIWNVKMRPWEEQDLLERFGDEYEVYRLSVPCWRPRFLPYEPHPGRQKNPA
jgi:protein-S-isoprenylcysteine O-methyltransferase Ste14